MAYTSRRRRRGNNIIPVIIGILAVILVSAAILLGVYSFVKSSGLKKDKTETAQTVETGMEEETVADETEAESEEEVPETEEETEPAIIFADKNDEIYIKTDQVNIRKEPSTDCDVLSVAEKGDHFERTGSSEQWDRIVYEGTEAFVSSEFTTTEMIEKKTHDFVDWNPDWKFASNSKINSGQAVLYYAKGSNKKGVTVCVNAGHGTSGGGNVKTLCHPDGSAKVTGGSTGAGATTATAVASGTTMNDGTPEAKVTVKLAKIVKDRLLAEGYDVLMIRESDDVQLDNIARTVMANQWADCHIALHYDSTQSDKGVFFMSVPDIASYRSMEPVASHWQQHNALGSAVIKGMQQEGMKVFGDGSMGMDLTQTSYSTVPSIDLEVGDRASDYSDSTQSRLAEGIANGLNIYFAR